MYLIILFVVFGVVFAVSPLLSMLPKFQEWKYERTHKKIQKVLENLKKTENAEEKAELFISLMKRSYVLIHIMSNQGGKYNDKKQMKRFEKSLTTQSIEKLKMIGEQ